MQQDNSSAHGIKWGVIIGLVYFLLLFLRFRLGADNATYFGLFTFVGFIVALILLFLCGYNYRKKAGGFVQMKDAFKTMFIAVLIFELFYSVFTLIYLKYIDPRFFEKFRNSTERIMLVIKQPQADTDKILAGIDQWAEGAKNLNVFDFLKTYLFNVATTGLFALIFSFILKRKQPFFPQENFNRD